MNTQSNKLRTTVSYNENTTPWWGDTINSVISTTGDVLAHWLGGQQAPSPQVNNNNPAGGGNNNPAGGGNNNPAGGGNMVLYVGIGLVAVVLLVLLLKK